MPDPDVVADDAEPKVDAGSEGEAERRSRPWYVLLAVVLLLLLLLCCAATTADVVVTRGPQQARFIARNLACLQCHTELIPDFTKADVHSPFAQKECTTCHTPHGRQVTSIVTQGSGSSFKRYTTLFQWLPLKWWFGLWDGITGHSSSSLTIVGADGKVVSMTTRDDQGNPSYLTQPEDKLCWICHGNMGPLLDDQYQHQPFSAGHCTNCHNPHASDYRALLTQAPNKICFTCHPMGEQLNRMQAHPPAKEGWCTDCHNPHASEVKGILVAKQRELCFRCHPTVAVLSEMPVQHQPFQGDNCTGCHEAHGSDYPPLLDQPQPQLCYSCHPAIQNQFAQPSHHPIGVDLQCGSCHDPHAAQYRGLIDAQDNDFCYQCHGDKTGYYQTSAHKGTLCIKCHTPHGSQYAPILVESNPDLCLNCHPDLEGTNKHPVRPVFFDVHAKKGLTCSSSCHDPHGTKYDFMLKGYPPDLDGICLQCHKTVGLYF